MDDESGIWGDDIDDILAEVDLGEGIEVLKENEVASKHDACVLTNDNDETEKGMTEHDVDKQDDENSAIMAQLLALQGQMAQLEKKLKAKNNRASQAEGGQETKEHEERSKIDDGDQGKRKPQLQSVGSIGLEAKRAKTALAPSPSRNVVQSSTSKPLSVSLKDITKGLTAKPLSISETAPVSSMATPKSSSKSASESTTAASQSLLSTSKTKFQSPSNVHRSSRFTKSSALASSSSSSFSSSSLTSSLPEGVDPRTKLRVGSWSISSTEHERMMSGKKYLRVGKVASYALKALKEGVTSSYVTTGVLITKSATKQGARGNYSVWRISDLTQDEFALLVSGPVHNQHWKLVPGTLLSILNPTALKDDTKGGNTMLVVNDPSCIVSVGKCLDFGTCKGTKQDGTACKTPVNTSQGLFCHYHLLKKHHDAKKKKNATVSPRQALSAGMGRDPYSLVRGGKAIHLREINPYMDNQHHHMKSQKLLQQQRMQRIISQAHAPASNSAPSTTTTTAKNGPKRCGNNGISAVSKEKKAMTPLEKIKHEAQMKHIAQLSSSNMFRRTMRTLDTPLARKMREQEEKEKASQRSCGEFLQRCNIRPDNDVSQVSHVTSAVNQLFSISKSSKPMLARGASSDGTIDLRTQHGLKIAKMLKKKIGPIPKANPNTQTPHLEKKSSKSMSNANGKGEKAKDITRKKSSLADIVGNLKQENMKELLSRKSHHAHELEEAEDDRMRATLQRGVEEDKVEDQLRKITEKKVTCFCCKECRKITLKISELCKEKKHNVLKQKTTQRFFNCQNCLNHIFVLGQLFPAKKCKKCGSNSWMVGSVLKKVDRAKRDEVKVYVAEEPWNGNNITPNKA
eukprot:m.49654 g.49654  ORF g.49654 m.49654 type:complete len:855 (+) comp7463_c0_seq1:49-2613(+)